MLSLSTIALASEVITDGGTDIVQRTVNFVLFAGLVWYLIAEPVKNFFNARSQGIADELKKVQDKLNESIDLKNEAIARVAEAEKFAEELAVTTQKENKVINDNIVKQCEVDLETLTKQQQSINEFEQRKMVKEVVENLLDDILTQSSDNFDKKAMANVILKKVA
jgi:F-type H+-transporting ATPase subunit b